MVYRLFLLTLKVLAKNIIACWRWPPTRMGQLYVIAKITKTQIIFPAHHFRIFPFCFWSCFEPVRKITVILQRLWNSPVTQSKLIKNGSDQWKIMSHRSPVIIYHENAWVFMHLPRRKFASPFAPKFVVWRHNVMSHDVILWRHMSLCCHFPSGIVEISWMRVTHSSDSMTSTADAGGKYVGLGPSHS